MTGLLDYVVTYSTAIEAFLVVLGALVAGFVAKFFLNKAAKQAEKTKNTRMGEELKKTNSALVKTKESLEKAQKPIDQGSPELDGEAQEIVLENYLKS